MLFPSETVINCNLASVLFTLNVGWRLIIVGAWRFYMSQIQVTFQPTGITVMAEAEEDWLAVAQRAGVEIPTSCLAGSCGTCEVELEGEALEEVCRTCIGTVPHSPPAITVYLLQDPTW
jgi:hypothetical protein